MPKYEIRNGKASMRGWNDPVCNPLPSAVSGMYEAGLKMYVDGKRLSKDDAVKFCEKASANDKRR